VRSAAVFVFVGVGSNHFRYVRDIEVTVQGLVGDVPGGNADHSEHFALECLEDLGVGWLAASHSSIPYVQMGRRIAVYTDTKIAG